MYEHILEIERAVFWIFGNVTCAAYPLEDIDTIKSSTGEINPHSALYQIVYGVRDQLIQTLTLVVIPQGWVQDFRVSSGSFISIDGSALLVLSKIKEK